MPKDRRRLPRPKKSTISQTRRKDSGKSKKKGKQSRKIAVPPGDGVLFPSSRTPSKMNSKVAKKIRKAKYKF
ncbi:MAG: hypothetical protein ACW964_04015 [Candidatus Hodarchaeales archaeon]